jgi:glycosyltransferase involved in cell wall biosynthesis
MSLRQDTAMRRVLIWSSDPVGTTMAGPGIRAYNFAKELSGRFEVTLAAPGGTGLAEAPFEVVPTGSLRGREAAALVGRFDAVVAQRLPVEAARRAARAAVRLVYDLYVPSPTESLALLADQPGALAHRELRYREDRLVQEVALRTGDAFVCASERQRDLWLGALAVAGRLDVATYAADPTLRVLIDVVPFGLDPTPPVAGEPAFRGVVEGIGPDDRILVWGGGIWNWFDPLTPIRAVGRLAAERDDVRLVFLGMRHPSPAVEAMRMAARAVELARELRLEGRSVFFNREWIPYERRGAYLLEADLGVSSHFDSVETRFAFRTRLLDYFWAGLPTIATRGDELTELVEEHGLGRSVRPEDVDDWVEAIRELLSRDRLRSETETAAVAVRARLAWPRVVEPLARLLDAPSPPTARTADAIVVRSLWAGLRTSLAGRGVRGTVRAIRGRGRP